MNKKITTLIPFILFYFGFSQNNIEGYVSNPTNLVANPNSTKETIKILLIGSSYFNYNLVLDKVFTGINTFVYSGKHIK